MKHLIVALCLVTVFAACKNGQKSSETADIPRSSEGTPGLDLSRDIRILTADPANFVTLAPVDGSEGKDFTTGPAYVDSVERVYRGGKFGLLITGSLPDGCSALHSAGYTLEGSTANLTLRSRKPAGAMCTQALVPYSFFLEIAEESEFADLTHWTAGESSGDIQ